MKRGYAIAAILTAAVCFFMFGFFLGRNTVGGIVTEKPIPAQDFSEKELTAVSDSAAKSETAHEKTDGLININTADAALLQTLPGIGEKLAEQIVQYRDNVGGFSCKEQLMEVSGIGQNKYEAIEPLITLGR